jgi:hypothetical protein
MHAESSLKLEGSRLEPLSDLHDSRGLSQDPMARAPPHVRVVLTSGHEQWHTNWITGIRSNVVLRSFHGLFALLRCLLCGAARCPATMPSDPQ